MRSSEITRDGEPMRGKARSRLRWLAALALGLGCAGLGCAEARAAGPVAMVTDMKGRVSAGPAVAARAVALLSELASGEQLHLGKDSLLVITYMKSGSEFQFTGPADIAVGENEPQIKSGAPPLRRGSVLAAESIKLEAKGGRVIQGGIGMRNVGAGPDSVRLLAPAGKLFERPAQFEWNAGAPAGRTFAFELAEGEGGGPLLEAQVKGGAFSLPEGIELAPGKTYSWRIEFDQGRGNIKSLAASFSVAGREERERFMRLKPGPEAPFPDRLVYAALLEQALFRAEAKQFWRALAAERPESRELQLMADK